MRNGGAVNNFGIRLKILREKRGLCVEKLAKKVDIDKCALGMWEKGKRVLSISKLIKLAQYFGVSIDYLVGL